MLRNVVFLCTARSWVPKNNWCLSQTYQSRGLAVSFCVQTFCPVNYQTNTNFCPELNWNYFVFTYIHTCTQWRSGLHKRWRTYTSGPLHRTQQEYTSSPVTCSIYPEIVRLPNVISSTATIWCKSVLFHLRCGLCPLLHVHSVIMKPCILGDSAVFFSNMYTSSFTSAIAQSSTMWAV